MVMNNGIYNILDGEYKMLRKWVKILPYCVVMWFTKKFNGDFIETTQLGKCRGFRIDKGEWVLFSEHNYNRMRENERKQEQTKLEKKKDKLLSKLNKDFLLKEELKKEFEYEEQRENEERMYDY